MLYLSYTLETCTHNILYIDVLFVIIKSTKRNWNPTFAFLLQTYMLSNHLRLEDVRVLLKVKKIVKFTQKEQ